MNYFCLVRENILFCYNISMKLGIHYQLSPIFGLPRTKIKEIEKIVRQDLGVMKKAGVSLLRLDSDYADFLFEIASFGKKLGFQIWIGPKFHRKIPMENKERFLEITKDFASKTSKLDLDVFVVGNELSVELKDFAEIQGYQNRCQNWEIFQRQFQGKKKEFSSYLDLLAKKIKRKFSKPITYATGSWELDSINWSSFDIVSANLYWWKYFPEREYISTLKDLRGFGKPVAVTEFGFQTIKEAFEFGPSWIMRKKFPYHYNEKTQVELIKKNIEFLQRAGAKYAFLHQWREADNNGFGVVRADGEPKKGFYSILNKLK